MSSEGLSSHSAKFAPLKISRYTVCPSCECSFVQELDGMPNWIIGDVVSGMYCIVNFAVSACGFM